MQWIELNQMSQLEEIKIRSFEIPVVIYKHSTRCAISSVVKNRLEKSNLPEAAKYYYLNLIKYRDISNAIAKVFSVIHESPQVIIIKDGIAAYHASHFEIQADKIMEFSS